MRIRMNIEKYSGHFVISLMIAVFIELYRETRYNYISGDVYGILADSIDLKIILKLLFFFAIIFVLTLILERLKFLVFYIDKYRYFIAGIIVIVCTILEISGSSIGVYYETFGNQYKSISDLNNQGVLLGIPRSIRMDEYIGFTPLNFSQKYNEYSAVSEIQRGVPTDVTTFFGSPSFSLATLFRPFLWGYILFGNAKGLAFFWVARCSALILVSYEFGKVFFNKDKVFSVAYAFIISFSQTIQFWYSINGLMEMLIFGQLAVVLLYYLFVSKEIWKKVLISLFLVECAGGFFSAYYPAWQIPLAYIFFALVIYIIIDSRKLIKKIDIVVLIVSVVAAFILIGLLVYHSWDVFVSLMNTSYPGARLETGGEVPFTQPFFYFITLFNPFDEKILTNIVCDTVFFSVFPMGIILSIVSMIKKRQFETIYILLIMVECFLLLFCVVGFHPALAKITLLSYCPSIRVMEMIGLIDILLLFRVLSIEEKNLQMSKKKLLVCDILTFLFVVGVEILLKKYGVEANAVVWISLVVLMCWNIHQILYNNKEGKRKFVIVLMSVITVSGLCYNPVQKGTDVIYEDELVKKISEIRDQDKEALWITNSESYGILDIPITVGAKTINCHNLYPNLELWHKLDVEGRYEDIYNKNAFIHMNVIDGLTFFEDMAFNRFRVNINYKDLDILNVSYILSDRILDYENLDIIDEADGYYIYRRK